MPKRAVSLIRHLPVERSDAFVSGLARCGFDVVASPVNDPGPDDVLVTWNRQGADDVTARRYERAGARVIVAENAYVGADPREMRIYALAIGDHNGAGTWTVGDGRRWHALGIDVAPWRSRGDEIVVLPQRGIGRAGVAMPIAWPAEIERRLRSLTDRPIRVRQHPGRERPPLVPDLENAHAAVTWGSSAALKAIIAGIPVFYDFPRWIGSPAASSSFDIERPWLGDRSDMLRRLSWAQWTIEEIRSGEAISALVGVAA